MQPNNKLFVRKKPFDGNFVGLGFMLKLFLQNVPIVLTANSQRSPTTNWVCTQHLCVGKLVISQWSNCGCKKCRCGGWTSNVQVHCHETFCQQLPFAVSHHKVANATLQQNLQRLFLKVAQFSQSCNNRRFNIFATKFAQLPNGNVVMHNCYFAKFTQKHNGWGRVFQGNCAFCDVANHSNIIQFASQRSFRIVKDIANTTTISA